MVATVIGTVVGILCGALVTFIIARRVSHRPTLHIRLDPRLVLSPEDLDVHGGLTLSVGRRKVRNLCVLLLEIECRGQRGIKVTAAERTPRAPVECKGPKGIKITDAERTLRPPTPTPLPRLNFEDFRIIGIRTLNNNPSRFYVPITRHSHDRGLYLNIHYLQAGATAQFQVLGELESDRTRFEPAQCKVFPGAITDARFDTGGAIARPWLSS